MQIRARFNFPGIRVTAFYWLPLARVRERGLGGEGLRRCDLDLNHARFCSGCFSAFALDSGPWTLDCLCSGPWTLDSGLL